VGINGVQNKPFKEYPVLQDGVRGLLMEFSRAYCPNRACKDYRKRGLGNIVLYDLYGKRGRKLLRCKTCNHRFSERKGSIFFGLHTDEKTIGRTLRCLSEGKSIRATARDIGIDKDTVYRIFERARAHYERILSNLLRDFQMDEGDLEDLWSFFKKRKKRFKKAGVEPKHIAIDMAE
jgi:LacI family transcriptional regulator